MPTSYLTAATGSTGARLSNSQQQRLRHLLEPTPTSFPLVAALHLLQPRRVGQTVYLVELSYLENWLCWALHQQVIPSEESRVREAVRMSAQSLGLVPPFEGNHYGDPGPLDASKLSMEGHPLLISPLVRVHKDLRSAAGILGVPRVRSAPSSDDFSLASPSNNNNNNALSTDNHENPRIRCVAVSEAFYETLRAVHGVLCDDGFAVSFQPAEVDRRLLLHHSHSTREGDGTVPRPIEFRRKIIRRRDRSTLLPLSSTATSTLPEPASLMEKLLLEESERMSPALTTCVEVHPLKLTYNIVNEHQSANPNSTTINGFILVSRDAPASETLLALLTAAEPSKATESMRLWCQHFNEHATKEGDGYELVDMEEEFFAISNSKHAVQPVTIQEWVERHLLESKTSEKSLHLLIETRKTLSSPWPREKLELPNRIQVGDFCDAQDVAGKWYEAVVRKVEKDTITIHYVGWASRWDAKVRRRKVIEGIEGINTRVACPSPLWTRTKRWREKIRVGEIVEVRDSSSLIQRPKWYRGEIKSIGGANDAVRKLSGGAVLETYPVEGVEEKEEHLILLRRAQQVLVQVDQEKNTKAGNMTTPPGEGDLAAGMNPQPPFLRWVNLYGEEICEHGTHLKIDHGSVGPVTIRYETDGNRKPVEVLNAKHPMLGAGFMRESLRGTPPGPGAVSETLVTVALCISITSSHHGRRSLTSCLCCISLVRITKSW